MTATESGPHARIPLETPRLCFAATLFDRLWERYRQRVSYVRDYERVIAAAGATFVNDHIAFRTFAAQQPLSGIASLSRIFDALGYRAAGLYHFEDKRLNATHFQPPHPELPKLFISELRTWELDAEARGLIRKSTAAFEDRVTEEMLVALARLDQEPDAAGELLEPVAAVLEQLPWPPPEKADVDRLNQSSQYGAWVLVHGLNVNHFTALINSQGVEALSTIDKTVAALQAAGVPMKEEIEGDPGAKLRQSATKAVVIDVDVCEQGAASQTPWTYAYFELAERGNIPDPQTGKPTRFEGFLGPQATHLFEMTRRDS